MSESVAQNKPDGELVPPRTGNPLITLEDDMLTWLAVAPFQSVSVCVPYVVSTWLLAIYPLEPYTNINGYMTQTPPSTAIGRLVGF